MGAKDMCFNFLHPPWFLWVFGCKLVYKPVKCSHISCDIPLINPNIHQISGAEKLVAMSETAGGTERRNVGGWVEQPTAP